MHRRAVGLALIVTLVGISVVQAQAPESRRLLVRARAVYIAPNAKSSPGGLDVKDDAVAEVDVSYFFTPNLAAELVLATAGQEVMANGASLGSVSHLPPTLALQYHFTPSAVVRPYVGGGVNYTTFYSKSGGLAALDLTSSFGWAAQVGADFQLAPRTILNVDAKYVQLDTDVTAGATQAYHLDINPVLIGVGLGYRF